MVLPLDVSRAKSVKALETASEGSHHVFIAAQKRVETEDPLRDDIFAIGTIAKVLEFLKMPNGQVKILVEGQAAPDSSIPPPDEPRLHRSGCGTH